MTYEVRFQPTARRDLNRIPPRIVAAIIAFAYGDLAEAPVRVGKPLGRELTGSFSARRGSYRVLYDVDQEHEIVSILRIAHRSRAYRPR